MTEAPRPGSSTGLDPNFAAVLAYLGWWLTGLLFYFLEREDRFVRFHALQATVAFGGVSALVLLLIFGAFVGLFVVDAAAFTVMIWLAQLVVVVGLIAWLICLVKAFQGEWLKLPFVGDFVERLLARP